MDVHAWSNFTTKCGPLVPLKCKIWIYFQSVLRHWHDSTKRPVPFSRGTHLTTSWGTNITRPKPQSHLDPFSREIHGVHLVEKNNMKHTYRQLTKSMLSPLRHWKSERPGGRVDAAASGGCDKSGKDYRPYHHHYKMVLHSLLWYQLVSTQRYP